MPTRLATSKRADASTSSRARLSAREAPSPPRRPTSALQNPASAQRAFRMPTPTLNNCARTSSRASCAATTVSMAEASPKAFPATARARSEVMARRDAWSRKSSAVCFAAAAACPARAAMARCAPETSHSHRSISSENSALQKQTCSSKRSFARSARATPRTSLRCCRSSCASSPAVARTRLTASDSARWREASSQHLFVECVSPSKRCSRFTKAS
mmetsp:Transcript_8130/g.26671  ORF Transcript_8130/g.26671 Transcript_8130/m.26671 type:complete len:216 (-) Transcript_8130:595-1242(-)